MVAMDVEGYRPGMSISAPAFGPLLREWRQRRRMSQLDLALEGNISTRHLSFLETGRARPSRDMVLLLAEHLTVPLRDRNVMPTAAGYAQAFGERKLEDPALTVPRQAVELVIQGQCPIPRSPWTGIGPWSQRMTRSVSCLQALMPNCCARR
jgi:transcriptional regulator with XRE-family HTH domain